MDMTKKKYDWLLFDADHTLFDFDKGAEEALLEAMQLSGMEAEEGVFEIYSAINTQAWREFEQGVITREELVRLRFERFFGKTGISHDPLVFHESYLNILSTKSYLFSGARELVTELSANYQLGLVTNGLKEVQRPRLINSNLDRVFKLVFISGEIGHAKPAREYFHHAHEAMGRPSKERVLVVGDNLYADIKGAWDFGFHSCWYNPHRGEKTESVSPTYEVDSLALIPGLLD